MYHIYLCISRFLQPKNRSKKSPLAYTSSGSKTEIKKSSGQIYHVIIVYLKENSKVKDKFFKSILTQK